MTSWPPRATARSPARSRERIELADYEKWLILASYLRADDTAGKNSYHYHDATRSWRVVPWDFNAASGRTGPPGVPAPHRSTSTQSANGLFERLLADPDLGPAMRQRYRDALAGPLALDAVLAAVDAYAAANDFGARRDWARWEAEYRAFGRWSDCNDWTSYDEEVQYLRDWLTERDAALKEALVEP